MKVLEPVSQGFRIKNELPKLRRAIPMSTSYEKYSTQHSAPTTATVNAFCRACEVPVCATTRSLGFVQGGRCLNGNWAQLDPPPCKLSVADHRAVDCKRISV